MYIPYWRGTTPTETPSRFRYTRTKFSEDGWADASIYKPIPYDLVTLETDRGKKFVGWYCSKSKCFEGLRMRPNDNIVRWRRILRELYFHA